jgi:flagellin
MTRINTNISSLVAQNILGRSNGALQQALTRLSTGLRINTGKDDPAGLIASENLRSDITAIKKAISNTDRANQVIATADSALGQVSSLLNDIRGLITETANAGVVTPDQIAANQLQLDESLSALNRIAQTTTFQGRRLLDGSLDFITTAGANFANIEDLQIDQANLGATGSVSVAVTVTTAATQAQIDITGIPTFVPGVTASDGTLTFQTAEAQAAGTIALASGDVLTIDVLDGGTVDGAGGNDIDVQFVESGLADNAVASVTFDGALVVVTADFSATSTLGSDVLAAAIAAVNGGTDLAVTSDGTAAVDSEPITTHADVTSGGVDEVDALLTISPTAVGVSFNRTIVFDDTQDLGAGLVNVTDDGTTLTIEVDDDTDIDLAGLATAIEAALDANDDFDVTLTNTTGDGEYNAGVDTAPVSVNVGATTAGVDQSGGISSDVVLELAGSNGAEVLSFGAGTSLALVVQGINLASDATGVTATANGTTLELLSSTYGSESVVDVKVIEEGAAVTQTFTSVIGQGARNEGTDVIANVNGISAIGRGNQLLINTATLDVTATMTAGFTGTANFTITGGGALFQLGPDVVSSQQARIGITSVNTARLGGVSGKLFQLGTGGDADLRSDNLDTAAAIVGEAIDELTFLRGRLGAFQRTSLETNRNALNDTVINLTEAESQIRDADFAAETAALTRAQILVQSGTVVLQIANQNPQNVLALLQR